MKNKNQKRNSDNGLNLAYVIITLIIFAYFSIWFIVKNRMKDILSNKTARYSIEYEKLSVRVFPFSVKTVVKGLNLSTRLNNNYNASIFFETISAKNIIFNKHINLNISNDILFKVNDRNSKIALNGDNISFVLGKGNKIRNVNFIVDSIDIIEYFDDGDFQSESLIKGFLFKTVDINTKNYSNRTIKMDMNSLVGRYEDKYIESNFDLILSEIRDIDSSGKVVSAETTIDSINFNDITNNYGFNLAGNYEVNPSKGRGIAKLELKIINYNSLITALNKEDSIFFFKKELIQSLVESLKLVPQNEKDTIYDKYYKFESNIATKTMTINGGDIKNLLQGLIF